MPPHPHLLRLAPAATAIALVLATAAPATAQRLDHLTAGAHVRVRPRVTPPAVVSGEIVRADSASITVARGRRRTPVTFARDDIARIDMRVSRRSVGSAIGRGALRGAIVGVVVGGIATGAAAISDARSPCNECFFPAVLIVGVYGAAFTVATTVVGGAIGLAFRDRWERVALR